jgi:hypothetical protein
MSKAAQLAALIGSGQAQGDKNLIINGKFSIFQRGTGATTVNGNDVFAADRFKGWANGGGTYTVEQSTDVPNNEFEYSAKLTNTGVDSSVAAGDNYRWATDIEGYNVSQLGYGHSDAKAVTLSFWVKSSLAGTYCGALYSTTASRHYIYEYTISSANTWEKKTITVSSGDTTGSWNKTNGNGLRVYWGFGSGSNYQGTAGSWTAGEKWETSNQAAWIGSASATFFITGVSLEIGDVATPFEHESFAATLQKCQRYYTETKSFTVEPGNQSTQGLCVIDAGIPMRAKATTTLSGALSVTDFGNTTTTQSSAAIVQDGSTSDSPNKFYLIRLTNFSGLNGRSWVSYGNSNYIILNAEL